MNPHSASEPVDAVESAHPAPSLDKSPARIRRLFDQVAPRYDAINHLLSLGIDRSWRTRAARIIFAESPPEGPILDVCCGTGDFAIALERYDSRTASPRNTDTENAAVYGIDFSPQMLALGKKKILRKKLENRIVLREGDALALPWESDRFAVVSVAFGLRNTADTDRALAEMVRVAREGGVVAILDFDLPKIPVFSTIYRFYLDRLLPVFGQGISRNRENAYQYFTKSILQFDKGEALAERLRRAGLVDVRFQSFTFGAVTLYLGKKPQPKFEVGSE